MNVSTKLRTIAVAQIGAVLFSSSIAALATENLDIGKSEYYTSCAVCHGITGQGDGPMKLQLVGKMPDLTMLAKNNNGVFPFDHVYQVIDGRMEVKSHGSRAMPVWGDTFSTFSMQNAKSLETYLPYYIGSILPSRILALTEYLYRIQAK